MSLKPDTTALPTDNFQLILSLAKPLINYCFADTLASKHTTKPQICPLSITYNRNPCLNSLKYVFLSPLPVCRSSHKSPLTAIKQALQSTYAIRRRRHPLIVLILLAINGIMLSPRRCRLLFKYGKKMGSLGDTFLTNGRNHFACKKRRVFARALFLVLAVCLFSLPAPAKYSGGNGTPGEPYLISTADQMNLIGTDTNDWDKHFRLIDDIDLAAYTGTAFNLIGTPASPFTGTFDGNDHRILNFTYTTTATDYIGLFRYVYDPNAEIKNLHLTAPDIDAGTGWFVGALAGRLSFGTLSGCHIDDGYVSAESVVGGLVGHNSYGWIDNCSSSCRVSASYNHIGGLAGSSRGWISGSYSTGEVFGDDYAGGLVGRNRYGRIYDCYSTCDVSGGTYVGGLVGYNEDDIFTCYSIGAVSGDSNVGGLVGYNLHLIGAAVTDSFWNINTSGQAESDGGTSASTAAMQMKSTFTDAGWDFLTVWDICDRMNYPRFTWQPRLLSDFVCPYGVEINDLAAFGRQWLFLRLSADILPDENDGIVNFLDYAAFAAAWQSTPSSPNWNSDCDIAPEGGNDVIDGGDILLFFQQWLQFGASYADTTPDGGDGIVNLLDYAALADNWLAGL